MATGSPIKVVSTSAGTVTAPSADSGDGTAQDQVTYHVLSSGEAAALIGSQDTPHLLVFDAPDTMLDCTGAEERESKEKKWEPAETAAPAFRKGGPSAEELDAMSEEDRAAVNSVLQ